MQIKYFQTAWGDIRNSQGWFGKLCLLSLVSIIPVFGQIVLFGYLYGWAREIAWGVHEPLPAKIFGNEDGKLYRRGWFILVITFVFALIPSVVMSIGSGMQNAGYYGVASSGAFGSGEGAAMAIGTVLYLVGLVGSLIFAIFSWIASMRVAVYDKLSAGFQFGKIWKMFRRDTGGIMRIFGMNLLVGLIFSIVLSIIFAILFTIVILVGVGGVLSAGYAPSSFEYMTQAEATQMLMRFIAATGVVGTISFFLAVYAGVVSTVFLQILVARAMGYWTLGFDVPNWRGQDDPMPFERFEQGAVGYGAAAQTPPPAQQPAVQPTAQPQPQVQQPQVQQPQVQQPQPMAQPQPQVQPTTPTAAPVAAAAASAVAVEQGQAHQQLQADMPAQPEPQPMEQAQPEPQPESQPEPQPANQFQPDPQLVEQAQADELPQDNSQAQLEAGDSAYQPQDESSSEDDLKPPTDASQIIENAEAYVSTQFANMWQDQSSKED